MPVYPYTQYLHDDWEEGDSLLKRQGIPADDPLMEKLGRPFYELAVNTEIDTDAGAVWITGINGTSIPRMRLS